MSKPYAEKNLEYASHASASEPTLRKQFPIYRKQPKPVQKPQPPQRLPLRLLFDYLNIWDCPITKKHDYINKFQQYLEAKRESIAMAEIEKQMQKPDFIKFFKYLKEKKEPDLEEQEKIELDIAFTEKERRLKYSKKKSSKQILPQTIAKEHVYPSSFDPHKVLPQPSPDDFIIVTHFFKQLLSDPTQKSVSKGLLVSCLLATPKFLAAYRINKFLVEDQLSDFPTKLEEYVTLEEFINFVLYPKVLIVKDGSPQTQLQPVRGENLFSAEQWDQIAKKYAELDQAQQNDVSVVRLVAIFRTQVEFSSLLFAPYLNFGQINHSISFEKWLYELEVFCNLNSIEGVKLEWLKEQKNSLFDIPNKSLILRSNQLCKQRSYNKLYQFDQLQLPSHFYAYLERIFSNANKETDRHALIDEVVSNILCDAEFIKKYFPLKVRQQPTNQLPIETVEQTVQRIKEESEKFIDLDDLIDFFIVRGRPLKLSQALKRQYKDPEAPAKSKPLPQASQYGAINKQSSVFYITIPQGIKEESPKPKSLRQKAVEQMLIDKEREVVTNMNQRFKAHGVPWYVTEPLYDQFNRQREERRLKVKEESKAKLMEGMMAPKSFEKLPKRPTPLDEGFDFKYKSRPVPSTSTSSMYEKMVFERQVRSRSNVARRKHDWDEYFANSTQNNEWESREEERKLKKRIVNKKSYSPPKPKRVRAKSMPNFERLHAEFENQLIAKKKDFQPTIPFSSNLCLKKMPEPDGRILDHENFLRQQSNARMKDIESRLEKILKSEAPNIPKTKSSRSVSKKRREQRIASREKKQKEEDEVSKMKQERKELLPKGIKVSNPAAKQQKLLDDELEELVQWKRRYHRNLDKDYKKDLQKMKKRVKKLPLLMYQNDEAGEDDQGESDKSSSIDKTKSNNEPSFKFYY